MADAWYYGAGGSKQGPIDTAELKRLAGIGAVKPETLIWKSGLKEWVRAERIKGLFAVPASEPLPQPPPAAPTVPAAIAPPQPAAAVAPPAAAATPTAVVHNPVSSSGSAHRPTEATLPQDKKATPKWVWVGVAIIVAIILFSQMRGGQDKSGGSAGNTGTDSYASYNEYLSESLQNARRATAGEPIYWKGPPQSAEDASYRAQLEQQSAYNRRLNDDLRKARDAFAPYNGR